MGLYRRGKTYWFSITYQGKRIQRSTDTDNKKLAEKIHAKTYTEIIEDRYFDVVEAKKHTFDELMKKFMSEYAVKKEVSTQMRYVSARNNLRKCFHDMTLADIKPRTISSYVDSRKREGAKVATINRELGLLSKAFNLALKQWEWCTENPCSRIQREPENNRIDRWLTQEEEAALLKGGQGYLNGQLVEIIVLALNTGMRQGELLSLKWTDVDLFRKVVSVRKTKNKEPKVIPLNKAAYEMLLEKSRVVNISGYVFATQNGTMISRWNLRREFMNALAKAEITGFRFHDLRHTFATKLVQAGIDLYRVARLLGHRDITSTQRYAHHYPESLRSSVEILDICYKSATISAL
jgi:site-specific recombinase XerD